MVATAWLDAYGNYEVAPQNEWNIQYCRHVTYRRMAKDAAYSLDELADMMYGEAE
jgi:hypothetical protein